jgi:hypothetical protein
MAVPSLMMPHPPQMPHWGLGKDPRLAVIQGVFHAVAGEDMKFKHATIDYVMSDYGSMVGVFFEVEGRPASVHVKTYNFADLDWIPLLRARLLVFA